MTLIGHVSFTMLFASLLVAFMIAHWKLARLKEINERQARIIEAHVVRFVPRCTRAEILDSVRRHLEAMLPAGVKVADVRLDVVAPGTVEVEARLSKPWWRVWR